MIRDRIVDLRRVKASELLGNKRNWREHPQAQRDALQGILDEIGYIDALVARETDEGLELLDGHLRKDLTPDMEVPVLVVDLTEGEADEALATFDPVGAMATKNDERLGKLLDRIRTEDARVRRMVSDQEAALDIPDPGEPDEEADEKEVPGMALEPHEHYDYLLVCARNTHEWNVLLDLLGLEPVQWRRNRMGTGRAIRASELLPKMKGAPSEET